MKTLSIKRFIFFIVLFLLLTTYINPPLIVTANSSKNDFNILVVSSYNTSSEWESFVIEGVKRKLDTVKNIHINYEYLDIRTIYDETYLKSFSDLLNLKYSQSSIDAVLTIDDEAFSFVRSNLFNATSIFFKKPIVFTGVNENIPFTTDETSYIRGVYEIEDNTLLINMIINIHKDLEVINIILDNATYSTVVKNNLLDIEKFFSKPIKLNFIQSTFIEDITKELSINNNSKQVNIIIGDFKYKDTEFICPLTETIKLIESTSPYPIYTKSQPYLFSGVIGGITDWGQEHGVVVAEMLLRLSRNENIETIIPTYDSLEQIVFNYKVIKKYKVNPLLLPENSIFINKGPLDFLLPVPLLIIVWIGILLSMLLLIWLIYNLTYHKRNSKRNKLLYIESQKSEKIKTEFISNVSHELRTPLNIILSTCSLLTLKINNSTLDTDYLKDKLGYIDQNSNRLLRLVNNILDVTRIDSGFMMPHFKMENIVEVIEDTVLSVVDFAKSHNIEIIFDTEKEEIITAIDQVKIERALLNLLSNAIKFTLSNGIIKVCIRTENLNIIISVNDTGIGIPEEYLPFIFERFKQVDASFTRENEGTGLGLSIVKGIIELHNGTINVTSTKDIGSTFTIILPISIIDKETPKYAIEHSDISQIANLELSDIK
ncbi:MAG: HAMP domain-containing sensor histidine kinase [Clostridium sp.]